MTTGETIQPPQTEIDAPTRGGTTPHEEASAERVFVGTGMFWGLIIGLVLAVAVVILAAQNTDTTTITFLVWDFSTPLIVLILGSLLMHRPRRVVRLGLPKGPPADAA